MSDFTENYADFWHKVDGIGMPDHVEGIVGEMREIAHIALNGFDGQTIMRCRFPVSLQLSIGKIAHRYMRPQERKGHRLLTAPPGQAEYVFACKLAKSPIRINL